MARAGQDPVLNMVGRYIGRLWPFRADFTDYCAEGAGRNIAIVRFYAADGVVALGFTRRFGGFMARLMPKSESAAVHSARFGQRRSISSLRAAQEVEIASRREDSTRTVERARITRDRELEVAEQDRQIIIAQKSEEVSRARFG